MGLGFVFVLKLLLVLVGFRVRFVIRFNVTVMAK